MGVLLVQTLSRPQWGCFWSRPVQTSVGGASGPDLSRPQWGVLLVQTRSRPQWGVLLIQTRSRPTLRSRFPEERAGQNTSAACVLCVCGAEVNPAQSHNSEQSGGTVTHLLHARCLEAPTLGRCFWEYGEGFKLSHQQRRQC